MREKIHTAEGLTVQSDKKLFQKSSLHHQEMTMHQLLPPLRAYKYLLHKRGHPFMLPFVKLYLFKASFVNR